MKVVGSSLMPIDTFLLDRTPTFQGVVSFSGYGDVEF